MKYSILHIFVLISQLSDHDQLTCADSGIRCMRKCDINLSTKLIIDCNK